MSVLDRMGQVTPDYTHITKLIRPAPSLVLDDAVLKWYDIAAADAAVPKEIRELARDGLEDASTSGALVLSGDLGFVILHRCGESFYFLIVSTWRNNNELWATVWAKDGENDPSFRPWPIEETHHPTFCVWELGAVWHEQRAWSDYLRSQRDEVAKRAYLRASYAGAV